MEEVSATVIEEESKRYDAIDAANHKVKRDLHKEGILYLRVQGGGGSNGYIFPNLAPIQIVIQTWDGGDFNIPESDDDNLYIIVGYYRSEGTGANFKITEVVNLVQTSLWTERFKCGQNTAEFFVARA